MITVDFSEKVFFLPWIGDNYYKNPRILFLGESVYKKEGEKRTKNFAIKLIQNTINGNLHLSFFSKIESIFHNSNHYEKIQKDQFDFISELFWNDVAFYEYIQEPLNGPRVRPSEKQWEQAKEPFLEVIKKLSPDIIITLGFDTYKNLPQMGQSCKSVKYNDIEMEIWKYKVNGHECFICKVMHPSAYGFRKNTWEVLFQLFLKKYSSL